MSLSIRAIYINDSVSAKINNKHGVSADDVAETCERPIKAVWDNHPQHGRRLLLSGWARPSDMK